MRRLVVAFVAVLAVTALASAATLCTDYLGGGAFNVLAAGTYNSIAYTPTAGCQLGNLTFSNFSATDAGGVPNPNISLVSATMSGGTAYLSFNPNLAPVTGSADVWFFFQISGGITGIGLTNMGTPGSSIGEWACTAPFNTLTRACTGSVLANFSADPNQTVGLTFAATNPVYVFKDIYVPAGGHLSSFTESFIPEPMTFVLIGSGLVGLGLVRRKTRKG